MSESVDEKESPKSVSGTISHASAGAVSFIGAIWGTREIDSLLMDEAEDQIRRAISFGSPPQGSEEERLQARALAVAIMACHAALEGWANRILVREDRVKWSKSAIKSTKFAAKWEEIIGRLPGCTWDKAKDPALSLIRINKVRQLFAHFKAQPVQLGSENDPFRSISDVQPWITVARQVMKDTEHLT